MSRATQQRSSGLATPSPSLVFFRSVNVVESESQASFIALFNLTPAHLIKDSAMPPKRHIDALWLVLGFASAVVKVYDQSPPSLISASMLIFSNIAVCSTVLIDRCAKPLHVQV